MTRRHEPIPALTVEHVFIYRCGTRGRRYRRAWVAYRSAAQQAWLRRYCMCDPDVDADEAGKNDRYFGTDEYGADSCGCHDAPERTTVVNRLAKWLRWRDGRRAAMDAALGKALGGGGK
jgi:hypothetical protein